MDVSMTENRIMDLNMTEDPIISVRNLHKWYSGVHALKGVSLDFRRNEAVGLVGDNGAGKSTLISILAGLHQKLSLIHI